jgi:hypothetical protein
MFRVRSNPESQQATWPQQTTILSSVQRSECSTVTQWPTPFLHRAIMLSVRTQKGTVQDHHLNNTPSENMKTYINRQAYINSCTETNLSQIISIGLQAEEGRQCKIMSIIMHHPCKHIQDNIRIFMYFNPAITGGEKPCRSSGGLCRDWHCTGMGQIFLQVP